MLFMLSKPVLLLSTEESLHILHGNFSEMTEKGPTWPKKGPRKDLEFNEPLPVRGSNVNH